MSRKVSKEVREQIRAVEQAGGTATFRSGHVYFTGANGVLIGKSSTVKNKSGRAARSITQGMVDLARASAPPVSPKPRPVSQPALWVEPQGIPAPPRPDIVVIPDGIPAWVASPKKEGRPVEKTIKICDACEADGNVVGAVDAVTMSSMVTGKKLTTDLCEAHRDELFAFGRLVPTEVRTERKTSSSKGPRNTAPNLRCLIDGTESWGPGMAAHYRSAHPEIPWTGELLEATRAEFQAAHSNGQLATATT